MLLASLNPAYVNANSARDICDEFRGAKYVCCLGITVTETPLLDGGDDRILTGDACLEYRRFNLFAQVIVTCTTFSCASFYSLNN